MVAVSAAIDDTFLTLATIIQIIENVNPTKSFKPIYPPMYVASPLPPLNP